MHVNDFWKNRKVMQDKYVNLINDLYKDDFFITYTELEDEEIRGFEKLTTFSDKLFQKERTVFYPSGWIKGFNDCLKENNWKAVY